MDLGLQNKVAIVTGAAGGIGRPTARKFAEEGATVVCVDRDQAGLDELVASLPGQGHLALQADLSTKAAADAVVEYTLDHFGAVDVLAHLAAILQAIELDEVTEEQWNDHMAVNVNATFFLARAAAESMKKRGEGGRLVLMTSQAWLLGGFATRLPYATTKGAVTTMVRGLAKAYGPYGITANAIAPGFIDTAMMQSGLMPGMRPELENATPLRRFGDPDEVASVMVFLASQPASFIAGATIMVSGGFTLY